MELKRSLFFVPTVLLSLLFFEPLRNVYYIVPTAVVSVYTVLFNFPWMSKALHQKPVYFEDLRCDDKVDEVVRERFQKIFVVLINVCLSITGGVLVYYLLYRIEETSLSYVEIIGLAGGILSLYSTIQTNVGNVLLAGLVFLKDRDRWIVDRETMTSQLSVQ